MRTTRQPPSATRASRFARGIPCGRIAEWGCPQGGSRPNLSLPSWKSRLPRHQFAQKNAASNLSRCSPSSWSISLSASRASSRESAPISRFQIRSRKPSGLATRGLRPSSSKDPTHVEDTRIATPREGATREGPPTSGLVTGVPPVVRLGGCSSHRVILDGRRIHRRVLGSSRRASPALRSRSRAPDGEFRHAPGRDGNKTEVREAGPRPLSATTEHGPFPPRGLRARRAEHTSEARRRRRGRRSPQSRSRRGRSPPAPGTFPSPG
jgi:hypothetical protein